MLATMDQSSGSDDDCNTSPIITADNSDNVNKTIDPRNFLQRSGLSIAYEQPHLQLCKPKLLPLKTYSFIKMLQARQIADNMATTRSGDQN